MSPPAGSTLWILLEHTGYGDRLGDRSSKPPASESNISVGSNI